MSFPTHRASFRTISLGFAAIILIGTILLYLPISTPDDGNTSWIDCLFTATSATCVTGLVVHDTASHWSVFGQIVLLTLIQLGGMGVLTVALAFTKLSGRKIDLNMRHTMQSSISAPRMGGIVRLTGFIIKGTIAIELLGAVALSFVFCPLFGLGKGLWYALFHSISAFCNAGFDLMGTYSGPYSSLTFFSADPMINSIIPALIIIGGLGFLTWDDIWNYSWRWSKYSMQSKVILTVTASLLILPFLYLLAFEQGNLPHQEHLFTSWFQTVTLRTAGFNTADLTLYSEDGVLLMICLMLIGGSPGSTAGGMKNTTLAVLGATALSVYRRRSEPQCFDRRITDDTVREALAVLSLFLFFSCSSAMAISQVEGLPLLSCLFETSSAIATVGVTMGITPNLSVFSKLILICLMFFGRVGGLTIIYAAFKYNPQGKSHCPQGSLTVG